MWDGVEESCDVKCQHSYCLVVTPGGFYVMHQQNMLMLQRPERAGSTQEGWEQNSTFKSSLNTPGACQEWLGIVWRVCASSCQELRECLGGSGVIGPSRSRAKALETGNGMEWGG